MANFTLKIKVTKLFVSPFFHVIFRAPVVALIKTYLSSVGCRQEHGQPGGKGNEKSVWSIGMSF